MFFAVTKRIFFELNQNWQKRNKVLKIKLYFNDYMSRSLYVLMLIFLSKTSAKTPDKHEFKRSAKQFDYKTYNFNFSLF